jgi:hypothetical protein
VSPAFDWRDMVAAASADPATRHRPEPDQVQREILRLHRQGLTPRDLATLFALDDAVVHALIFGRDEAGSV